LIDIKSSKGSDLANNTLIDTKSSKGLDLANSLFQ